jgi:hypothetical protein
MKLAPSFKMETMKCGTRVYLPERKEGIVVYNEQHTLEVKVIVNPIAATTKMLKNIRKAQKMNLDDPNSEINTVDKKKDKHYPRMSQKERVNAGLFACQCGAMYVAGLVQAPMDGLDGGAIYMSAAAYQTAATGVLTTDGSEVKHIMEQIKQNYTKIQKRGFYPLIAFSVYIRRQKIHLHDDPYDTIFYQDDKDKFVERHYWAVLLLSFYCMGYYGPKLITFSKAARIAVNVYCYDMRKVPREEHISEMVYQLEQIHLHVMKAWNPIKGVYKWVKETNPYH